MDNYFEKLPFPFDKQTYLNYISIYSSSFFYESLINQLEQPFTLTHHFKFSCHPRVAVTRHISIQPNTTYKAALQFLDFG